MTNYLIIIFIITLCSGFFGGLINFLQLEYDEHTWLAFLKSTIVGIGASFVVPLFLQTISSDLITQCGTDNKYYFVYAGFCLIASIFSKRFLDTVAESVIKKAENAERKAKEAVEIANDNEEKITAIVDKNSEPDFPIEIDSDQLQLFKDDIRSKVRVDIRNIINVFKNSKYTYRSSSGIAKEIGSDLMVVEIILEEMETIGYVKKFPSIGKVLWTLTKKGSLIK